MRRLAMAKVREILRLNSLKVSQRQIAEICNCSRNTVSEILKRCSSKGLEWPLPEELDESKLDALIYSEIKREPKRKEPDWEYVHKELARSDVNLQLVWEEYFNACIKGGEQPLMYSRFCHNYGVFAKKTKAVMHLEHKPGEEMYVDWGGQTMEVVDRNTGLIRTAHMFLAALGCSKYTYAEAFPSEKQECWIAGHVSAYNYFGGVSRITIPDNLKTGVIKSSSIDPVINKVYFEMAEHYQTAIVPARVRKPKDKPIVEKGVADITIWIIGALRDQVFFSFEELNEAIRFKLDEYNCKPFQKLAGSRLSVFTCEEKHTLIPLPATPYEIATWKIATVQFNYHISFEKMLYSVPYEYIQKKVDIRATRNTVEILYEYRRICSHKRLYGTPNQYSTDVNHMPDNHKQYLMWNSKRFEKWALSVGPSTQQVISLILASKAIEQQAYRSCFGILKLADSYTHERLENACRQLLQITSYPSYKNISSMLKTNQDRNSNVITVMDKLPTHQNIRGAEYYKNQGGSTNVE